MPHGYLPQLIGASLIAGALNKIGTYGRRTKYDLPGAAGFYGGPSQKALVPYTGGGGKARGAHLITRRFASRGRLSAARTGTGSLRGGRFGRRGRVGKRRGYGGRRRVSTRGRGAMSALWKTCPPVIMVANDGERFGVTTNNQAYFNLSNAIGGTDGIFSNHVLSDIARSCITNGANAVTNLAVGSSVKVQIGGYTVHSLRNQHSAAVHISLYVLKPRQGGQDQISPASDPVSAIAQGYTDEAAATAPYTQSFYGGSPHDSVLFNQLYKVIKVEHKVLQPGETMKVSLKLKTRVFDCALLSRWNTIFAAGKYTRYLMIRCRGEVSNDSVTPTQVGSAGVQVDHLSYDRYKARCLVTHGTIVQTLVSGFGTVSAESVMNVDSATAGAAVNA